MVADAAAFMLGVDVFLAGYTKLMAGKRVGLITNQTGCNGAGTPTIDLLYRHPDVKLVALFAPEHGIRGRVQAGAAVPKMVDSRTGVPVYSLYGSNDHRPEKVVLDGIDVLIYDIQDVGSRAYTYIWSMAEAMAAAGETGKEFVVFDRPNPLGGHTIDGPVTEPQWLSFIGLYPIPRVYGMTVGELARYLNGEHGLNCRRLTVIPMAGYTRDMPWHNVGMRWVPPSPNIPSPESAVTFAATGTIGTLGCMFIGIGTPYAFQVVGAPWIKARWSAEKLNARKLPGVTFKPVSFAPPDGPFGTERIEAVLLKITDTTRFWPATTELVILDHLARHYRGRFRWRRDKLNSFDKAMGTSRVRQAVETGRPVAEIVRRWGEEQQVFRAKRKKYLIYE